MSRGDLQTNTEALMWGTAGRAALSLPSMCLFGCFLYGSRTCTDYRSYIQLKIGKMFSWLPDGSSKWTQWFPVVDFSNFLWCKLLALQFYQFSMPNPPQFAAPPTKELKKKKKKKKASNKHTNSNSSKSKLMIQTNFPFPSL